MLILTGPSASGKTEIAKILINKYKLKKFVTYTTRPIRPGEVDGVDYHFVTEEEFLKLKNNNEFIETTCYNNNYYGSRKTDISYEKVVILDPSGVNIFRKHLKDDVVIIFLNTQEEIRKQRMIDRLDQMEIIYKRLINDRDTFKNENYNHVDYSYTNELIDLEEIAKLVYETYIKHLEKNNIKGDIKMSHKILVETSARHVHITEEHLKILFGPDAQLTFKKELSQPGQFASEERVSIVGPRNTQHNVIILGPCRKATQVEVSATDARSLGLDVVVRESGDIKGTPGCTIIGPKGQVEISEGVIVAKRHIHLDPKTAEEMNLEDKEIVQVEVESDNRSLIYGDVVVRVRHDFSPAMHIDTDEANAASVKPNSYGTIIKQK